jgi:hypothetical protein
MEGKARHEDASCPFSSSCFVLQRRLLEIRFLFVYEPNGFRDDGGRATVEHLTQTVDLQDDGAEREDMQWAGEKNRDGRGMENRHKKYRGNMSGHQNYRKSNESEQPHDR